MSRAILKFLVWFAIVFCIDQAIKWIFLSGFYYQGSWIDLVLTFNKGVAFSMFAFLGPYLKIIQVILVACLMGYFLGEKKILCSSPLALGLVFGGGCSNILDRFIREGVVDYIYWHKWFSFAVFNFADMMIDLGILILIISVFRKKI